MNLIFSIALVLPLFSLTSWAADCPWWDWYCVPTTTETRDATIYEAPPEERVEERVVIEEAPRYSTRGTEAWGCVDKKTVRKTNLMLTFEGNYLFEDIECAKDELCLTPEEIKLQNIVKWDEIEKEGKIYGYPGQILTETEAQQLISNYLPHAMCKPIAIHNEACENTNLSATAYYVISMPTIDPTLPPTKYGIFHTEVCAAGMMCFSGQCMNPKDAGTCVDSDKTVVVNGKPDWKSIITPGQVTAPGGNVTKDKCKDSFLQEWSCDADGNPKMVYVGCGPWGTCDSDHCVVKKPPLGQPGCLAQGHPDDLDLDGVPNAFDNCPYLANTDQKDLDGDGKGDACDFDKQCPMAMLATDSDLDGLADDYENKIGTDPNNPDTDFDAMNDAAELEYPTGLSPSPFDDNCNWVAAYRKGVNLNPLNPDTDGDGILDGIETGKMFKDGACKNYFCCAANGVEAIKNAGIDLTKQMAKSSQTNPLLYDSDGDNLPDGNNKPFGAAPWGEDINCGWQTPVEGSETSPVKYDSYGAGSDYCYVCKNGVCVVPPMPAPACVDPNNDGDLSDAIVDASLRKAIQNKLGVAKIDDVTAKTLKELTAAGLSPKVATLAGLQCFQNVETLAIGYNDITDLSPIQGMTKLTWIQFNGNKVSDLAPFQNMKQLIVLSGDNNLISDLTPLKNLVGIYNLFLRNNKITDISVTQWMVSPQLQLAFDNNPQLKDIQPLINNTGIGKLSGVSLLNDMQIPESQIQQLKAKGVKVFWP